MQVKRYLYNKKTDKKFPINGAKRSDRDFGAVPIQDLIGDSSEELPRATDLRDFMSGVELQSTSNSCVANSLVGAYEYLLRRYNNDKKEMSRLFVYYNARDRDPVYAGKVYDGGCFIGDAIESLRQHGACTEDKWKYDDTKVDEKPTSDCYEEARNFLVTDSVEVGVDLKNMKTCLARGFPFVFSLKLYQSFARAATNRGQVSVPEPGEPPLDSQDQHAMLAVGYNDEDEIFVVRNSWGTEWGAGGYGSIPYAYMTNPEHCSDVYTIKKLSSFDLPHDHWVEDPSKMRIGESSDFGGNRGGGGDDDDDWKVIDEVL